MTEKKQFYLIFADLALIMAGLFFFVRIPFFDGEVVFENGINDLVLQNKLSLSYFLNIGFHEGELKGVNDFYLLPAGYLNAILLILALPALVVYRVYLLSKKKLLQQNK